MYNYYEYSSPELVRMLGERFKDYRMRLQMTQKDVADQAGLSVMTISKFESGAAANISLGTFFLMMKAVGDIDGIDRLLPELPESPYLAGRKGKKLQRIRRR